MPSFALLPALPCGPLGPTGKLLPARPSSCELAGMFGCAAAARLLGGFSELLECRKRGMSPHDCALLSDRQRYCGVAEVRSTYCQTARLTVPASRFACTYIAYMYGQWHLVHALYSRTLYTRTLHALVLCAPYSRTLPTRYSAQNSDHTCHTNGRQPGRTAPFLLATCADLPGAPRSNWLERAVLLRAPTFTKYPSTQVPSGWYSGTHTARLDWYAAASQHFHH